MEERKRKKKFTAEELEILTKEVSKNESVFKGPHVSASKKNRVWENIAVKVNAVGHDKRSVEELKKRYQDLRRRTKEKLVLTRRAEARADSGQADTADSTQTEESVQASFSESQLSGVPGVDTLDCEVDGDLDESSQPSTDCAAGTPKQSLDDLMLEEMTKQTTSLQQIALGISRMEASLSSVVQSQRDWFEALMTTHKEHIEALMMAHRQHLHAVTAQSHTPAVECKPELPCNFDAGLGNNF